jgi:ATP-dependent helicase/nuclease subunit A
MSEFKPTPAQERAIRTIDRSVCVRAGAGTGKTSVLVGRYMELLRTSRASVGDIAALTYTEKAAKVMKDRIRQECLREEENARAEDRTEWWRRQRIDLENASIGTIHGFCSHILAEHPVEAGVDPYFTVLDEVQASILLDRCVDDVLRRRLSGEDADVLSLCMEFPVGEVHGMLSRMIARRAEAAEAFSHIESKSDGEVLEDWRRLLVGAQAAHAERVADEASRRGLVKQLAGAKCTDPKDRLEPLRREALEILGGLAKETSAPRKIDLARRLRRTVDNLRVGSPSKWAADGLEAVKGAFKGIRDMLDEVLGGSFERSVSALDERSLAFTRCLARLFADVSEVYGKEKAEGGYLDFEDLLLRARGVLDERSDVRGRLQDKIRYLLVDELQDTALVERDIIMSLVRDEKRFESAHELRILPGKLFVVGDEKQSIYRFRGAEVTVFRDFAERMAGTGEGELVDLDASFRTVPRGVAFANDFFGRLFGREGKPFACENRYSDLKPVRREDTSFLEVMVPEEVEGESTADARTREARMIAARIDRMVSAREKRVWDKDAKSFRPVRYGDVAVLFRAMTTASIYENEFRQAGLPYYIHAGSGFYRAQEIMDLLAALKCLERPRDAVALVGTLRSPLFGISDETLFFMKQRQSVRAGLDACESVEQITDDQRLGLVDARDILRELTELKNRIPISRLLEEILRKTGYDATLLAQFMGRQKLANVEKLIDLARSFETKGLFTLDEFIRYIEDFVSVEARESERAAEEESSNVVWLMSVHRAKGLEFPVVFVADMSHHGRGGDPRLVLDRELGVSVALEGEDGDEKGDRPVLSEIIRGENRRRDDAENLRLLYVALTRACDYLVLSGSKRKVFHGQSWMNLLSDTYSLFGDDEDASAGELVFGEEGFRVPVQTAVPPMPEEKARLMHHAAWKVVKRIRRLAGRAEDAERTPRFERAKHVEPLDLDLAFKRRFTPSEFTEYRYCPQRYRLSRILGILPADVGAAESGRPSRAMLLGTAVHRVLAAWDFDDRAVLEQSLDSMLAGEGLGGAEEAGTLRAEAKSIITRAAQAGVFAAAASSSECWKEYPLAARVGDFVIDGILDCIYRLEDGTYEIVDYKTDRIKPEDVPEKAKHYELQLASYAVAFSKSGKPVSRVSALFLSAGRAHVWTADARQIDAWERMIQSCVDDIRSGKFDDRRHGPCLCGHTWICGRTHAEGDGLDLV